MKFNNLIFVTLIIFLNIRALANDTCKKLASEFIDNRIYVNVNSGGKVLKFYTDSGGGLYPFIYDDIAKSLKLSTLKSIFDEGEKISFTDISKVFEIQGIPHHKEWNKNTRIFTYSEKSKAEVSQIRFIIGDGFLGAPFFADHVWHFDYENKELKFCTKLTDINNFAKLPFYFKGSNRIKDTFQARMEIEVFGKKHSMLFDTGATSLYSKEAIMSIQPFKEFTASSFIRDSVAKEWIKNDPKIRVIKGGEKFAGGGDLIKIDEVKIANIVVGPVWFATRNDKIYDKYSREIMDANIDGAVGGNLFKYFDIITDYQANMSYWKKN